MMKKFYRHFRNGKIYRFLHIAAIESNPAEKVVVYQAMYDDGTIWTRPFSNFFEKVISDNWVEVPRFSEVPEDEALKEIPPYLNPNYSFPDIEYSDEIPPLLREEPDSFSPSVLRMISLMRNCGIVSESVFCGLNTDEDLEQKILQLVTNYHEGDDLETVFHLIEAWGGIAGRALYNRSEAWVPELIITEYSCLVNFCLSMTKNDEKSMDQLISAIRRFDRNVKHLGVAFITKHTHFWLSHNFGKNALPIYDRIMAQTVMLRPVPEAKDLKEYWLAMKSKAEHHSISLSALERQIFNYAAMSRY